VIGGSRSGACSSSWNPWQIELIRRYWRDIDAIQADRLVGTMSPEQARVRSAALAGEVRAELRFWIGMNGC
jgi:hypothetical protein